MIGTDGKLVGKPGHIYGLIEIEPKAWQGKTAVQVAEVLDIEVQHLRMDLLDRIIAEQKK